MQEILIACGEVELLKKIIADLPPNQYKPIATKRGAGIAAKIQGRGLTQAIVHVELADGTAGQLLQELQTLSPVPSVLLLTSDNPPKEGPFEAAIRYPVPGPVLRNAIKRLGGQQAVEHDLDKWRIFYRELKEKTANIDKQSYYKVMGLEQGANHNELVRAFDYASLRYHPDRYNQYRSEKWGEAIYQETNTLYKVMTEAYFILSDRKLRQRYDEVLKEGQLRISSEEANSAKKSGPASVVDLSDNPMAKKFLKLAQTDIAAKSWQSALQNLRFALSMESSNEAIKAKIAEIEAKS
jgi:hypothetical protein